MSGKRLPTTEALQALQFHRQVGHFLQTGAVNMINKKSAIFYFTFILLFSLPTNATFIKCSRPRSVKAEFANATHVFAGEVIAEEERKIPNPRGQITAQVYLFQVERYWKGKGKKTLEVYVSKITSPDGESYFGPEQVKFQPGVKYLIYGFAADNIIYASGCTRTAPIKYAQKDLLVLGKGQLPELPSNK